MSIKISALATAATLYGNTIIPIVEQVGGLTSKKIEASTLRNFFSPLATSGDSANLIINTALIPTTTSDLGNVTYKFGNLYLDQTFYAYGALINSSGIQSASTTTGAITVAGGIGATGNINAGNVNATNFAGTLITANQPNITTVGNLSSLATSGTISAIGQVRANSGVASTSTTTGALTVRGGVGVTGNINAGNVNATFISGTLIGSALSAITSVGTLTGLTISGNITPTANAVANVGSAGLWFGNTFTRSIYSNNYFGTVRTATQANITSLGNLTTLSVAGNLTTFGINRLGNGTDAEDFGNAAVVVNGGISVSGRSYSTGIGLRGSVATTQYWAFNVNGAGQLEIVPNVLNGAGDPIFVLDDGGGGTVSSQNIVANANTSSTSSSTGALVVVGGAGIGGNLNVAGNVTINGTNELEHSTGLHSFRQYVLGGLTTGATETEIFVGNVNGSRIPITANSSIVFETSVIARRTDAIGFSGGWSVKGVADNFSGNVQDVGNLYEIIVASDDANLEVDVRSNDITNALSVYVTGTTGMTYRWSATVKITEVGQ